MIFKTIFVCPKFPENLQHLYELASNIWTLWDYDAIGLFYRIDTPLFRKVSHNPLEFLHRLTTKKLQDLSKDKGFLFELEKVWQKFQDYINYEGTFKNQFAEKCSFETEDTIAYFSMEYGLHESIRLYAGGLGVLAGDFLKGASDLAMPVVGIGLLYKYGYFTQHIDVNGQQQEIFTKSENYLIPVRELYDTEGNWTYVNVRLLDWQVRVKLWTIDIGRSRLILLDTDIVDNPAHLRDITNELYAGDREKRLQQELVLGIGGIKALDVLGIKPKIYHINEGHCAFAVIARLKLLMTEKKLSFSEAKAIIRASTVFTTHTPVIAGNENFEIDLVKKYLQPKLKSIDITFEQISKMGLVDNNSNIFWLPAFVMHFSGHINGVSKQHTQMSRKMWTTVFHEIPIVEIPIHPITNGVHMSWISPPFVDVFKRYLGPDYIHCGDRKEIWQNIYNIPHEELWEEHRRNKKDLINFIKRKFSEQTTAGGYSQTKMLTGKPSLNIDYLTIVFARRFAAYKRPTLILKDKERFKKILTCPGKPVQIIFAGKAHPNDQPSKQMIKEIIDFAREYNVEDRVIFLEDYDLNTARHLHWGADVWLNNPAQQMEASGTSGMKAAMNGVLHLSTLEGWWREGYNGKNGWAVTAGNLYDKWNLQETADANQLYDLLEHQITELYYSRNEVDIPDTWVTMMKNAIFSVCRDFNINRMLRDYINTAYIPAKENSTRLSEKNYSLLKKAIKDEELVLKYWDEVEIVSFLICMKQKDKFTEGELVEVQAAVRFGQAPPQLFNIELFYLYKEETAYRLLSMERSSQQENITYYKYNLEIEGYGSQALNVRIKPANEIVCDIHPELIKWKD